MCVIRVAVLHKSARSTASDLEPSAPSEKMVSDFSRKKSIVIASAMGFARGQTCRDAKKMTNSSLANWAG